MEGLQRREGLYGFEFREPDNRRAESVKDRKTYEIKQMWQRTHEIVNLAARGFKNVQIAEIVGITPETVSNTLNSQLGMAKLSELRAFADEEAKVVQEKIKYLTKKALTTYQEIFDSEHVDHKLKKDVADTVMLELSGMRVPTKIQGQYVSTVLTKDELEEFKQRGIKAARESGMLVEVEENTSGCGADTSTPLTSQKESFMAATNNDGEKR
jgi:predicted transcriptional regulator